MRVLFVQLKEASFYVPVMPEPLAYEILAATIPHHDVDIFDMRLDKETLEEKIKTFKPDIVGVGCATALYHEAIDVFKITKKINKEIITVIGGHHAFGLPQDFIGFADYIVIGEGESTFRELVDSIENNDNIHEIPGLAFVKDGKLVFTEQRPLIDLDDMPFPNRLLTRKYRSKYYRGPWKSYAAMVASKGCSSRCLFCTQWNINRGKFRTRSPEKIVEELLQIEEKYIDFLDDNSWQDTKWIEGLYQKIKEAQLNKKYKLYARSDLILKKPDIIEKWRSIGLTAVLVGFESFNDKDLEIINKNNSVENNIKAAKILNDNGIAIVGYFIVYPNYSYDDFNKLQEFVITLNITQPVFLMLNPLPGSRLFDEVKDQIITKNQSYFDGMHAILPTKLPVEEFYKQFTELYRNVYTKKQLLKNIFSGKLKISFSQTLLFNKYLKQLSPVEV